MITSCCNYVILPRAAEFLYNYPWQSLKAFSGPHSHLLDINMIIKLNFFSSTFILMWRKSTDAWNCEILPKLIFQRHNFIFGRKWQDKKVMHKKVSCMHVDKTKSHRYFIAHDFKPAQLCTATKHCGVVYFYAQ